MSGEKSSIIIDLSLQLLNCKTSAGNFQYSVSTAFNGPGQELDTGCTPLGLHAVIEKIGDGLAVNTVFVGRRVTDELYSEELAQKNPNRDWILTRILWLTGLEDGFNKGGRVDTKSRYIYIHGCPDSIPLGVAGSAGCVRMNNKDVIELFDLVEIGTLVQIID